jgi:hypothetical protein
MAHEAPTTSFQAYLGLDGKKKTLKYPLPLPRNVKSKAKVLKQGEDGVYKNKGNFLTKEGFDHTEIVQKPSGKIVSIKRSEASKNNMWIQAIRLYYSTSKAKAFPKVMSPTKYKNSGTNREFIENYRKISKIYVVLLQKQLKSSKDPEEQKKLQEKIDRNNTINKENLPITKPLKNLSPDLTLTPNIKVDSQDLERRQKYQKLFDAEYSEELRKFRADLYQKRGLLEDSKSDFYIKNSL